MTTMKLNTYTALIDFTSIMLKKTFKKGDQIKAPASLGADWVSQKIAIKNLKHKIDTL